MLQQTWRNALSRSSRDKQDRSPYTKEYYKPPKKQSAAYCLATQQLHPISHVIHVLNVQEPFTENMLIMKGWGTHVKKKEETIHNTTQTVDEITKLAKYRFYQIVCKAWWENSWQIKTQKGVKPQRRLSCNRRVPAARGFSVSDSGPGFWHTIGFDTQTCT